MKKFYNTTIIIIIEVLLIVPAIALILAKYAFKAIVIIAEESTNVVGKVLRLVTDLRDNLIESLSILD